MALIETILQTLSNTFKIGGNANAVTLEAAGGKLAALDNNDDLVPVQAGTPSAGDDVVTKSYGDSNYGVAGAVREIQIPFDHTDATAEGTASVVASTQLPLGAVVKSVDLKLMTGFDGGVSLEVGLTADTDQFMGTSNNVPGTAGTYSHNQRAAGLGSAEAPRVTLIASGTPSQGEGVAYISYSVPQS